MNNTVSSGSKQQPIVIHDTSVEKVKKEVYILCAKAVPSTIAGVPLAVYDSYEAMLAFTEANPLTDAGIYTQSFFFPHYTYKLMTLNAGPDEVFSGGKRFPPTNEEKAARARWESGAFRLARV